ncbi:F-type H+-transporting ATPase subunit c [Azospirillaceae bacterium]
MIHFYTYSHVFKEAPLRVTSYVRFLTAGRLSVRRAVPPLRPGSLVLNRRKDTVMDPAAAKFIGAGLAMVALAGVGLGIGNLFAALVTAIGRNPSTQPKIFPVGILGFAMTEAVALFALLVSFLILFS